MEAPLNAQTVNASEVPRPNDPMRPPETTAHTPAARWLGRSSAPTWPGEARRMFLAAAFASLFGIALGLRKGGVSILVGAVGAPAGIVAVAAVAVPAFAIVLALANAPLDAMDLARATSRAAMRAGLLLAGLAPGVALLVVTCEEAITVDVMGFGALVFAGGVAAYAFAAELRPLLVAAPRMTRAALSVVLPAFLVFAAVLAARVWWLALPMLTEIS
jgi:hypothetical protein